MMEKAEGCKKAAILVAMMLGYGLAGCSPPRALHLYNGKERAPQQIATVQATKLLRSVDTTKGRADWYIYIREIAGQRVGRGLLKEHDVKHIAVLPGANKVEVANTLCGPRALAFSPERVTVVSSLQPSPVLATS